jgi:hypothetical protein
LQAIKLKFGPKITYYFQSASELIKMEALPNLTNGCMSVTKTIASPMGVGRGERHKRQKQYLFREGHIGECDDLSVESHVQDREQPDPCLGRRTAMETTGGVREGVGSMQVVAGEYAMLDCPDLLLKISL